MTAEAPATNRIDYTTQQIRLGRNTPLESLQERYDTFRRWQEKDGSSYATMSERWFAQSGQRITRARVFAILHRPRPGTTSKGSPVVVLRRRISDLETRKAHWSARNTERGDERAAQLGAEIRELRDRLADAEKEARRLSKVGL